MSTKICYKCKRELDLASFKTHCNRPDGLQSDCISCQKEYRKEHYKKNKQKYLAKSKATVVRNVAWLREYKKTLKCEICCESHPACLQFHHIEPSLKDNNVSWLTRLGCSIKRLMEEIAKCRVLCANCHFKLHWTENNDEGDESSVVLR